MDIDKPLDEVCLSLLPLESHRESLPFLPFSGNSKLTSR